MLNVQKRTSRREEDQVVAVVGTSSSAINLTITLPSPQKWQQHQLKPVCLSFLYQADTHRN